MTTTRTITRTALVTGASSGIGEETARRLQGLGYTVYGAARRTGRLEKLAAEGVRPLAMDVTDDASMTAGIARIIEETGRIDVLINNAGYGSYGAIEDVPIDEARRQFEVNLFGLGRLVQLVTPHMRGQKSGTIINISSMGGRLTTPLGGWYHATKYAVEPLSDALRMELKPFGIDVVLVEPGASAPNGPASPPITSRRPPRAAPIPTRSGPWPVRCATNRSRGVSHPLGHRERRREDRHRPQTPDPLRGRFHGETAHHGATRASRPGFRPRHQRGPRGASLRSARRADRSGGAAYSGRGVVNSSFSSF